MQIKLFVILSFFIFMIFQGCSSRSTNDQEANSRNEVHTEPQTNQNVALEEAPKVETVEAKQVILEPEQVKVPEKNKEEVKPMAVVEKLPSVKPEKKEPSQPIAKVKPEKEVESSSPTIPEEVILEKEIKEEAKIEAPKLPLAPQHDLWDQLLRQFVSSTGKVNYKGFKAKSAELDTYLKALSENPIQTSWSRNEKMAYWINAYNAFTVKLIVDNYPISSIMKLDNGKPWDRKWIKLGDQTYSLNDIEHKILRPQYKDARIHFAVNCAAKSCPPLLHRAWTAETLNRYFNQQAKAFINNPAFNSIAADKIALSKIFEWYKEDFGDLITYLNKYSTTKINPEAEITFIEYDWNLNE